MDRGAWWPIVHGVTKSWERLEREREKCYYLALEHAASPEHPLGPLSLRHPASFLSWFYVGGSVLLPGEFKPDGQRIPAEI